MARRTRRASPRARVSNTVQQVDRDITPKRREHVSFEVVCRPRSGGGLLQLMGELAVDTLEQATPEERTVQDVAKALQEKGFTVFVDDASPTVSAEGPHELFEAVFQTKLRKRHRTLKMATQERHVEFFDTVKSAPEPSAMNIKGALYAAIQRPPIFFASALPPPVRYFHLNVPGDVAMVTMASATHRRSTPSGARATGAGVRVAMLDTGFFVHPYFTMHGYRLNPILAADAAPPATDDPVGHGTGEVANIFSTAPDAQVFGVKMGNNPVLSFDRAMAIAPRVISCSWGYHLPGVTTLPAALVPLRLRILSAVAGGVTVVFSGGNGQVAFPAMMPEVIAVGGTFANQMLQLRASNYASSFTSLIFAGRRVPDFCGLVGMQPAATYIMLPIPEGCSIDTGLGGSPQPGKDETTTTDGWGVFSGTSAAAPQVAGICALLLQKRPALTPAQVKALLRASATDVTTGTSFMGQAAGPGTDMATGTGMVNALQAWLDA
jgi:serine protease AprX